MSLKTFIENPKDGIIAKVEKPIVKELKPENGLVVYSEPRRNWVNTSRHFLSSAGSDSLNINGTSIGGAIEVFMDGGDTAGWTGAITAGYNWADPLATKTGVAGASFAGADGVRGNIIKDGGGSTLAGSFTSIQLDFKLVTWSIGNRIRLELQDILGTKLGRVNLELFFDPALIGVWQTVSIPLGVIGFNVLTTDLISVVQLRPQIKNGITVPSFYFDNAKFTIAAAGAVGPTKFSMPVDIFTHTRLSGLKITMAGPYVSTLASNSMPNLSFNKFLALLSLPIGLRFELLNRDGSIFALLWKQISDILEIPGITFQSASDGTNTLISFDWKFSDPVLLSDEVGSVSVTVNDDFSSFLLFKVVGQLQYEV